MKRKKSIVTTSCAAFVLTGCGSFPRNNAGDTFGYITVSSPRVEGRERLINDRREQERWLRDRLDRLETQEFGVSGAVDLRSLSSFGAQVGVDVDPVRKLNALNLSRDAASAKQAADDEKVLRDLRASQRDQIVAKVKDGSLSLADAQTQLTALGYSLNPSTPSTAAKAASGSASSAYGLTVTDDRKGLALDSSDARLAGIKSTPIEEFHDRLAAREVIRNELNDIRLDDLHDLSGNSLVRLTFDATVVPQENTSAWAIVKMKVSLPNPTSGAAKRILERAKDQYLAGVRETSENTFRELLQRLNRKCFYEQRASLTASSTGQREAFFRAFSCATEGVGSNARRAMERHLGEAYLFELTDSMNESDFLAARDLERLKEKYRNYLREAALGQQLELRRVEEFDEKAKAARAPASVPSSNMGNALSPDSSRGTQSQRRPTAPMVAPAPPAVAPPAEQPLQAPLPPSGAASAAASAASAVARAASDAEGLSSEKFLESISTLRSRYRIQAMLLEKRKDGELESDYQFRRATLAKWAIWSGQVIDSLQEEEFSSSSLSCFYDLRFNLNASIKNSALTVSDNPVRTAGTSGALFALKSGESGKPQRADDEATRCGTGAQSRLPINEWFRQMLAENISGSVYAVTPKESVQRISEVSSNRKTAQFLAGLTGNVQAAAVQAAIKSIRDNEALYQSVRRQPLVVGFTENGRVTQGGKSEMQRRPDTKLATTPEDELANELIFGWVIGPAFQLSSDGKETRFRHAVSQKSLAAELSLPVWMDAINVTYETYWLKENGDLVLGSSKRVLNTGDYSYNVVDTVHGRGNGFQISLASSSVSALAAIDDQYLRVPKVDEFQDLVVEEGRPASIMISGRNVWRSTEVFIGAQSARLLSILPDNRGVIATFGEIASPLGSQVVSEVGHVPLFLVTSEGRVVAGRVLIKDGQKPGNQKKLAVSPLPQRIIAGEDIKLTLSYPVADTDVVAVRLRSPEDKAINVELGSAVQVARDNKSLVLVVASSLIPKLVSGSKLDVTVEVRHPDGSVEVLPALTGAVFYTKAGDAVASVSASRKGGGPVELTFKEVPLGASVAFASLRNGHLKFQATWDGNELTGECKLEGRTCSGPLTGEPATIQALSKTKSSDIKLKVRLLGEDVPGISPAEVELK